MAAREDLPRISVDTVEDWQRLVSNCRYSASDILDKEIRSRGISSERDVLQQHMQAFISRTFTTAQPNLRVNGNSFDTLEGINSHDMETFDEALDRRIWSLADTRFQWDKRIAENRKNVPQEIGTTVSQSLQQHHSFDAETEHDLEGAQDLITNEDSAEVLQGAEDSVMKATALVEELSQTIQKQQERSKRLKLVSAEVKALRP
ncbi:hypothetical protein BKA70DRAFT_1366969 [Coprinopsis sp. MPI-PUGE-AT-0042]|nr:hypothetical protein BKA70DRAFT_1366969 [Coprinopsis sp. MPI-PUGE-AT-0042]